jgi:hypothetical protein
MSRFVEESTWWNRPVPFASGLPESMPMRLPSPNRRKPNNRHLGRARTQRDAEFEARKLGEKIDE